MSASELAGVDVLMKRLSKMDISLRVKLLRQAVSQSMTPVLRQAQMRVPVGAKTHKTYKGRWVAPGFSKRSIRRKTAIENGKVVVRIGVRKEAFYAVQFLELGTKHISPRPWLQPALETQQGEVLGRIRSALAQKIRKATR